jgi:hypothetical protein
MVAAVVPAAVPTWVGLPGLATPAMAAFPGVQAPSAFCTKAVLLGPPPPHAVRAAASAAEESRMVTLVRTKDPLADGIGVSRIGIPVPQL